MRAAVRHADVLSGLYQPVQRLPVRRRDQRVESAPGVLPGVSGGSAGTTLGHGRPAVMRPPAPVDMMRPMGAMGAMRPMNRMRPMRPKGCDARRNMMPAHRQWHPARPPTPGSANRPVAGRYTTVTPARPSTQLEWAAPAGRRGRAAAPGVIKKRMREEG